MQIHKCPHCLILKDESNFQLYKGKPNGWCRDCRTKKERDRRRSVGTPERKRSVVVDCNKLCMNCMTMKDLSEFSSSSRGLNGKSAYCKPCAKERYYDKEKAREATSKYRIENKDRWRSLHRVNMARRRLNIEISSDGTVTDEFLKSIYSSKHCHYCGDFICEEKRTADHMTPLALGGAHSAENIVMACFSCNSSKSDTPYDEYMMSRRKNDNHS